jgi:hypothetical protein
MRWRSVWLTACSAAVALALAGCGGDGGRGSAEPRVQGPRIEGSLADSLAARSDEVARRLENGDPCGARAEADALRNDLIAAVNEQRLPQAYLEDLTAAVNELAEGIPCQPPPPPPPPPPPGDGDDDRGKGKGKGKDGEDGDD